MKNMTQTETNQRRRTVLFLIVTVVILAAVTAAGILTEGYAVETDFSRRNLSPSLQHLFGTDWMGRDMLARTLSGLSLSIRIGILTAVVSAAVALLLGTASVVLGRKADAVISWCIDLVMGIPHILLVILLSIACGKGFTGIVVGVSLSVRERIYGSRGRSSPEPLAVSGESDPGGTDTALAGTVYPCGGEDGSIKTPECKTAYAAASLTAVPYRSDPSVPPCDPA